jgi:hypothetical protein
VSPPGSPNETAADYDCGSSQPDDSSRYDAAAQSRSTEPAAKDQHKACPDTLFVPFARADSAVPPRATLDNNSEGDDSGLAHLVQPILPDVQGLLFDHVQKVLEKIRARIAEGSELTVERHELNILLLSQPIRSQQVIPLATDSEAIGAAEQAICSAVPAAFRFGKWRQADRNAKRGLSIKEWLDALLESACFLCIETRYRRVKSSREQKYQSDQIASQKVR